MPSLDAQIDAQFFQMVHRQTDSGGEVGDRRMERRHRYDAMQKIAPYDGVTFPPEQAFAPVPCHDLTQSGFSFLLSTRPTHDSLVVSFEGLTEPTYFEARIVQVAKALVYPDKSVELLDEGQAPVNTQGAQPVMLIGCRLVRRLTPS